MTNFHDCQISNSRLQSYSTIWQSLSWSENFLSFMKLDIWLPYSKQADTEPHPEQNESRRHSHTLFLQSILILPYLQAKSSSCLFTPNFPSKFLCVFLNSLLGAVHLLSPDFITLIISGAEHNLWTFLLGLKQYPHIAVIFDVLNPDILRTLMPSWGGA